MNIQHKKTEESPIRTSKSSLVLLRRPKKQLISSMNPNLSKGNLKGQRLKPSTNKIYRQSVMKRFHHSVDYTQQKNILLLKKRKLSYIPNTQQALPESDSKAKDLKRLSGIMKSQIFIDQNLKKNKKKPVKSEFDIRILFQKIISEFYKAMNKPEEPITNEEICQILKRYKYEMFNLKHKRKVIKNKILSLSDEQHKHCYELGNHNRLKGRIKKYNDILGKIENCRTKMKEGIRHCIHLLQLSPRKSAIFC